MSHRFQNASKISRKLKFDGERSNSKQCYRRSTTEVSFTLIVFVRLLNRSLLPLAIRALFFSLIGDCETPRENHLLSSRQVALLSKGSIFLLNIIRKPRLAGFWLQNAQNLSLIILSVHLASLQRFCHSLAIQSMLSI